VTRPTPVPMRAPARSVPALCSSPLRLSWRSSPIVRILRPFVAPVRAPSPHRAARMRSTIHGPEGRTKRQPGRQPRSAGTRRRPEVKSPRSREGPYSSCCPSAPRGCTTRA
jgi:hypothetical protein